MAKSRSNPALALVKPQPAPPNADLKPYLSPLFVRAIADPAPDFHKELAAEVGKVLTAMGERRNRLSQSPPSPGVIGGLTTTVLTYLDATPAPWAPGAGLNDYTNHLAVVATKGRLAAICASEPALREQLRRTLSVARPLRRSEIEKSFVGSRAGAVWLKGVHRSVEVKPDSKMLTGLALECALDPLGDQSYYFSAIRSTVESLSLKGGVGAVPGEGRIWVNRPRTWDDFGAGLEALLDHVGKSGTAARQFKDILARELDDLADVVEAAEMTLAPRELFTGHDIPERLAQAEQWVQRSRFEVMGKTGTPDFTIGVWFDEVQVGVLNATLTRPDDSVKVSWDWADTSDGREDIREGCLKALGNEEWLKIYYDSGHTIIDGRIFLPNFKDVDFGWKFAPMGSHYRADREKPLKPDGVALAECIGKPDADGNPDVSLFAYVLERMFVDTATGKPRGWLASDDGSMEMADFIHIEEDGSVVSLVHVKAAGSNETDRRVSASKYEVVVGQALKNLRYLDRMNLARALTDGKGKKIGEAVWLNGDKQDDREELIAFAKGLRPGHKRQLIILQPQLTETEHGKCNSKPPTAGNGRVSRFFQLNTLLAGAGRAAAEMGAELIVYGGK